MTLCSFYLQGNCRRGSNCRFDHPVPYGPHASPTSPETVSQIACAYFQSGACRNGENCRFLHLQDPPLLSSRERADVLIPCRYHQNGYCSRGATCLFFHSLPESKARASSDQPNWRSPTIHQDPKAVVDWDPQAAVHRDPNAIHDDAHAAVHLDSGTALHQRLSREVDGLYVAFGDGASVLSASVPSDFSAVQLTGLSRADNNESVAQILRDFGHRAALQEITLISSKGDVKARITVNDPEFASQFIRQLRDNQEPQASHMNLAATMVPPKRPRSSISRRTNCYVRASWRIPTRLAWLNFGSQSIAVRVKGKFSNGYYQVCQQQVIVGDVTGDGNPRNPLAWTLVLKGIPLEASESDVRSAVRETWDLPRQIMLSPMSCRSDGEEISSHVERLFEQFRPDQFHLQEDASPDRGSAMIHFAQDQSAMLAVQKLNGQPQSFLNNLKLSLQLVRSSKLRVLKKVYDYLAPQVNEEIRKCSSASIRVRVDPDIHVPDVFIIIKIRGSEAKTLLKAIDVFEGLFKGQTLTQPDDETALWHPTLRFKGQSTFRLGELEEKHNIVLERNKADSKLIYYGPQDCAARVSRELVEYFDTLARGAESVPRNSFKATGEQSCSICWGEAERPVVLACSHAYCAECLENQCRSATTGSFPIVCYGDGNKCKTPISLVTLQKWISSFTLEQVLAAAARTFVQQRPEEFQMCPTPDCANVYRSNGQSRIHRCEKCIAHVCPSCHEDHSPMTCAEHRDLKSGGLAALARYKKEHGIQDCPKCTTPIEKTEGCNHMTCRGCGAHLCWLCLGVFKDSGACYAHLTKVHGRIMDIPFGLD